MSVKLTKEQRDELVETLSHAWGTAYLMCDGHRITLQVQRDHGPGISYRVMTYIDGMFKGEWVVGECPEQKFLRKQAKSLYSMKRLKQMEKIVGKRRFAKDPRYAGFHQKLTSYHPDWASGRAAIAHLCRVCEFVEIAPKVVVAED